MAKERTMRVYEIEGPPVPWMRAGRVGEKYYDRQFKEKTRYQWTIKSGMSGLYAASGPLKLVVEFHMPIPKSWARKKRLEAVGKPHSVRPDFDNLMKFVGDALNNLLWLDDAIIYCVSAMKFYQMEPKTRFLIIPHEGGTVEPLIKDNEKAYG